MLQHDKFGSTLSICATEGLAEGSPGNGYSSCYHLDRSTSTIYRQTRSVKRSRFPRGRNPTRGNRTIHTQIIEALLRALL